jgi:hypothetical protein
MGNMNDILLAIHNFLIQPTPDWLGGDFLGQPAPNWVGSIVEIVALICFFVGMAMLISQSSTNEQEHPNVIKPKK